MNRYRWLVVAGAVALGGCHATEPVVCVDAVQSSGAHHNADEVGLVECSVPAELPTRPGSEGQR